MLKAFKLRNYKNFKDEISINFEDIAGYQFSTDCISDGILSKMLIYGRNATGKTNLGNAIMDITKMLFQIGYKNEDIFINADAAEDFTSFSYSFQFDNNEIIYRYTRFSNFDLREVRTKQAVQIIRKLCELPAVLGLLQLHRRVFFVVRVDRTSACNAVRHYLGIL